MQEAAIKRFAEKNDTGEYYAGSGRWVEDVNEAKRFSSLSEAAGKVGSGDVPRGCCVVLIWTGGPRI